ncbi:hypothetical protein [Reinekea blandensis]|uniref:Uncharacterized protein n=1 Tax=Reinekea blandensis MED297 TaxID=314283 RepID=A4BDC4_9GAMM|nr:hypothetical protein [Reinekea blandensis]EAR09868.1 hypothetical protein MED297_05949 [Reinekea sp. MED297] [Reinekea blandensis MED297]
MLPILLMFIGGLTTILAVFSFFELVLLWLQNQLLPWGFLRPTLQLLLFSALSWYLSPRRMRRRLNQEP